MISGDDSCGFLLFLKELLRCQIFLYLWRTLTPDQWGNPVNYIAEQAVSADRVSVQFYFGDPPGQSETDPLFTGCVFTQFCSFSFPKDEKEKIYFSLLHFTHKIVQLFVEILSVSISQFPPRQKKYVTQQEAMRQSKNFMTLGPTVVGNG